MQRKKASDFDPRILELYDGYVHGKMSKRQFLDHAAKYTLSGAAAVAVLDSLQPNYALAQQVPPDDPAIETEVIEYDSPEGTGTVKALLREGVVRLQAVEDRHGGGSAQGVFRGVVEELPLRHLAVHVAVIELQDARIEIAGLLALHGSPPLECA